MFHHFLHGAVDIENPTFKAFEGLSGVDNLDPSLTINSITETPFFRYKGGDASAAGWPAWIYGPDLDFVSVGTDPDYNNGSPLLGDADDAVNFNKGDYFRSPVAGDLDITTEDYVIELVLAFDHDGVTNRVVFDNRTSVSADGIRLLDHTTAGGIYRFNLDSDGAANQTIDSAALPAAVWHHVLLFADRSASAQIYINGVASGAASDISAQSGSIASGGKMGFGAFPDNDGNPSDSRVAYIAMWKSAAWLDTHLQATVAQERFNRLVGIHPPKADGTAIPTVQTRATVAHIDKLEDSDTTRKLYQVGSGWLRTVSRLDSNSAKIEGYLAELTATNLCLQSEDLGTTWTLTNVTAPATAIVLPNKQTSTTATIAEDGTAATTHLITQNLSPGAVRVTMSCFAKAINRSWIRMRNNAVSNVDAWFNVSAGTLGTTGSSVTDTFIEDYGDDWFRIGSSFTAGAGSQAYQWALGEADNDAVFDGLTQDSIHVWGAQVEVGASPSSYIPTTTVSVARNTDDLQYKGDDGNLGGVGSDQQGTVSCNFLQVPHNSEVDRIFCTITDGGASTERIRYFLDISNHISLTTATGGGDAGSIVGSDDLFDGVKHNTRITWNTPTIELFVDGADVGTDSTADIPVNLDEIDMGQSNNTTSEFGGVLSNVRIFKKSTRK